MSDQPKNAKAESKKGYFIVIDGIDGCGKTYQVSRLVDSIKESGRDAIAVADPGATELGVVLRGLLLDKSRNISPDAQALLFAAARRETAALVQQRLDQGICVVADRWVLSMLAYQGTMEGIHKGMLMSLVTSLPIRPDVYILLDVEPTTAATRIAKRRAAAADKDRFENVPLHTITQRRDVFNAYISPTDHFSAGRICRVVDGEQVRDVVAGDIWRHLPEELKRPLANAPA